MHFAVVGRLDWDQMETVLCQTLGALPTVKIHQSIPLETIRWFNNETEHVFYFQDEPKAEVDLAFLQNASFSDLQRRTAKMACLILNERLRKHLYVKKRLALIMYLLDGIIRSTTKTVRS